MPGTTTGRQGTNRLLVFRAAIPAAAPAPGLTRFEALHLPGLPAPRFAAIDLPLGPPGPAASAPAERGGDDVGSLTLEPGDVAVEVTSEVRRGPVPTGAPYRMVSVARRNPALTRAELAERWRSEAGRLGGEAIPEDVRGLAYLQHQPVGDDPAFDAVNEVAFADLEGLRRRAEWFAARPVPADLWDPASSFALHLRQG